MTLMIMFTAGLATAFFHDNNSSLAKALSELMQEAKQEVPAWLLQYAARSPFLGRNRCSGGGGWFGGRDLRRDASFNRVRTDYDGRGYGGRYSLETTSAWD